MPRVLPGPDSFNHVLNNTTNLYPADSTIYRAFAQILEQQK